MSCALQIEYDLVNGVEISDGGTSTASSQSIDSKGDIRTSAKQKDEHAKESAKDPPPHSEQSCPVHLHSSQCVWEFAQIACCLEAPQW